MSIRVENLTKIYDTQKAVDNISFEAHKGEVVGFLGPNGAGKTTTLRIIACYMLPTSGNVYVNDYDIYTEPLKVKETLGYLPENNPLYDDMYIKEYLLFISKLHKIRRKRSARINELIELTGLLPEKHKKIGALSKGFRQRVGLAQALIHDPAVLLLDEPTSGLDPNQIVEIRNLIKEIGREKTIVLSSHIMQEVQLMCNRVIIINKGQIVADDETSKLISKSTDNVYISVEFKKPIDKKKMLEVEGIEEIKKDKNAWMVKANTGDVREKIFEFAVKNNNVIIEMSKEGENLEKVFQRLTVT